MLPARPRVPTPRFTQSHPLFPSARRPFPPHPSDHRALPLATRLPPTPPPPNAASTRRLPSRGGGRCRAGELRAPVAAAAGSGTTSAAAGQGSGSRCKQFQGGRRGRRRASGAGRQSRLGWRRSRRRRWTTAGASSAARKRASSMPSTPLPAGQGASPLPLRCRRWLTYTTGSGETSPSSHPLFHGCSPGTPSLCLPLLVRGLKKTTGFLEFVQTRPEHSHTLFQALHCVFGF